MKSFFKKLAFVMAMAMVVSLAAPAAANAAAGEVYLCYQDDAEKKEVTSIVMKEGDEPVDLRFINAPDYKELGWEYKTNDPAVVTVDQAGVITPVAEGATTVDFYVGGEKKVSVLVKVNPLVPANEYTLKQTTHEAWTLTYAEDVTYKLDDVQLYVVRTNTSTGETFDIPWPLHETKSKVEKNVITVVPFVALPDGTPIKVVVDGVPKEDTVKIGDITTVEIFEKDGKTKVFYKENRDDNFYLTYGFKLFSDDIDVTEYYKTNKEIKTIKWTASTGSTEKDQDLEYDATNEDVFELAFWADKLTAAISLEITDLDGKKHVALPESATSEQQPVWKLEQDVVWTITKGDKIDWSKPVHSLPADANPEEYVVVLKFESTRGDKYVTHEYGKVVVDADKNTYVEVEDAAELSKYELTFNSAKEDDLLINPETGALGVYKETSVLFYVGLSVDKAPETYVCADWITVTERTNLGSIEVDTKATGDAIKDGVVTVTTLTMDGYEDLGNKTVYIKSKNKAGQDWPNATYTVAVNNKKAEDAVTISGNVVTIIGKNLIDVTSRTVTVTVTGTSNVDGTTKATTNFTIAIKSVNEADVNKDDADFIVDAADSDKKILLDTKYTRDCVEYTAITIGDNGKVAVDLNASKSVVDGVVYAEIKLYKTSNGEVVGQYTEDDNILVVGHADDLKKAEYTTEGARYIAIKNNDKYVTGFWDGDVFKIPFNSTKDGEMVFGNKGDYDIDVVTVRYYQSRENKTNNYVVEGTLSVTNSTPDVTCAGTKTTNYTKSDIKDIVVETIKFNLGGEEWKTLTADMIANVEFVEVADTIIIRNVYFEVPVDGKTADAPFYKKTIYNINVAVKPAE